MTSFLCSHGQDWVKAAASAPICPNRVLEANLQFTLCPESWADHSHDFDTDNSPFDSTMPITGRCNPLQRGTSARADRNGEAIKTTQDIVQDWGANSFGGFLTQCAPQLRTMLETFGGADFINRHTIKLAERSRPRRHRILRVSYPRPSATHFFIAKKTCGC